MNPGGVFASGGAEVCRFFNTTGCRHGNNCRNLHIVTGSGFSQPQPPRGGFVQPQPPRDGFVQPQPPRGGFVQPQPPRAGFEQPPRDGFVQPPRVGFDQPRPSGAGHPLKLVSEGDALSECGKSPDDIIRAFGDYLAPQLGFGENEIAIKSATPIDGKPAYTKLFLGSAEDIEKAKALIGGAPFELFPDVLVKIPGLRVVPASAPLKQAKNNKGQTALDIYGNSPSLSAEEKEQHREELCALFASEAERRQHCDSLLSLAMNYEFKKDIPTAEEMYKRALAVDPEHVDTLYSYGVLLYDHKKDIPAAEEMYKRALAVNPEHVHTLHHYGSLLCDDKRDISVQVTVVRDRGHERKRDVLISILYQIQIVRFLVHRPQYYKCFLFLQGDLFLLALHCFRIAPIYRKIQYL